MTTKTDDLQSKHSEYTRHEKNWKLVRDLIKGESALKEHDLDYFRNVAYINDTTRMSLSKALDLVYIPYTSSTTEDNDIKRYVNYVQRASLFNATRRTEKGMSGMVFSKPSQVELPESIEYLETNADGSGVGILDQSVEALEDILETARCGLFVDYPQVDGELSVADLDELNVRANIIKYPTEQIIDWDTKAFGASRKLCFVKLVEYVTERDPNDYFKRVDKLQYRVLYLRDGIYYHCVYNEVGEIVSEFIPTDYLGQPFDFIPFFFIGATDNRPDVDIAPLLEIAELNIKHYRNSADYEESTYLVGQPMVGIMGVSQGWIEDNYPEGILFGSRQCLMLPPQADLKIVQAEANNMAMQGMKEKESQMKMLGARLITDSGQAETAEAARIRHSADASVLKVIVKNITTAYNDAIMAVQLFNGSTEEFTFKINEDFFSSKLSAKELLDLISAWQAGALSQEALNNKMIEGGFEV